MYKTLVVCEDCFLVYAELASSPNAPPGSKQECGRNPNLLITSNRQFSDLPAERLPHDASKQIRGSKARKKCVWMPDESPSIPAPIYSAAEVTSIETSIAERTSHTPSIEEMVKQRGVLSICIILFRLHPCAEETFFQEVKNGSGLQKGHPLTHLVTSFRSIHKYSTEHQLGKHALVVKGPYAQKPTLIATKISQAKPGHKETCNGQTHRSFAKDSRLHREFLVSTYPPCLSQEI